MKKLTKKLALNPETIRSLNGEELRGVQGGVYTGKSCPGMCSVSGGFDAYSNPIGRVTCSCNTACHEL